MTASTGVPALGARERRRRRTLHDLSHAAVRLFAEKGFEATTVEEIAQATDYSASTFFRMFARKEDTVFLDLEDRLQIASTDVADVSIGREWATMRAALLAHARTWEGPDPDFAAARVRLIHTEPALISRYLEHCHRWENDLAARIVASGGGRVDDTTAYLAAGLIVTAYRTAFRRQVADGGLLVDHLEVALELVERTGFIPRLFDSHA